MGTGPYPQGNSDIAGGIRVLNLGGTISLVRQLKKKTSNPLSASPEFNFTWGVSLRTTARETASQSANCEFNFTLECLNEDHGPGDSLSREL